jgi:hypothetical protein
MNDDATFQGSVGPLNDRTCEACGNKYGSEEPPRHPSLCPYCATVTDRNTKARKEEEPFNWFE